MIPVVLMRQIGIFRKYSVYTEQLMHSSTDSMLVRV